MSPIPRLHKETSLFNRTKTLSASFKVLADSITSLVEGKETYTDPDGNVTTNTFGTVLKQTANNVLIKATQGDATSSEAGATLITSLINVATNGVKIAASKVDIEGAAIFTGNGRLSSTSLNNAYDAKGTSNTATKRSQRIYYRSSVGYAPTVMPSAWLTETGNKYNTTQSSASGWSAKVTPLASDTGENVTKYPYLWTCEQREQMNGQLAYTPVLLDESSTVIDGGRVITNTITASKLNVNNINASGVITIGALNQTTQNSVLNSNVINSIKDSLTGFTILWNYENFTTPNAGEAYICAANPLSGVASDADGWVTFNNAKRTITKQMVNPNNVIPFRIPIYIVCRLSSQSATSGTNYIVWYDSGWKYASLPTPSAVGGTWTWNNATDIVLGKFVEPASEVGLTECVVYNPPLTSKHISTDTDTVSSAQATATSAQSTATTANGKLVSFRGVCSTSAGTAAKTVACAGFTLTQGCSVTVYNTTAQTVAGAITLNVNSLGAKPVWVAGAATSDTNRILWTAGSSVTYVYDGTNFRVADGPSSAHCTNCPAAEGTAAKTTSAGDIVIFKGTSISVPMANTNTASSPTLNVSSLGAANIYYGTSSTGPTKDNGYAWIAGTDVIFVYDGKFWRSGNQTYLNGGNILTGTVTADKLNVNDINAKHSLTIGALTDGAQQTISNAAKTATDYITYMNQTDGIKVTYNGTNAATQITSSGVNIINSSNASVASFGSTARLGEANKTRAEVDYHSLQLVDKEGTTYFYVSDLRDSTGYATMVETFVGDGTTTSYSVQLNVVAVVSVVDSSHSSNSYTRNGQNFTLSTAPSDGASVTITYTTTSVFAKAYTLGLRNSGSAVGPLSVAIGFNTTAGGFASFAAGNSTNASYAFAHAEGRDTVASGYASHAEGFGTVAHGMSTHAEGGYTSTSSQYTHAEGHETSATAHCAHAEGDSTSATRACSHSEGGYTVASGEYSHAEGYSTTASGSTSHAEGNRNIASGNNAHAEGIATKAVGANSHAEGGSTEANGGYSHAEGHNTKATASSSHSEGEDTVASGLGSHAEGSDTVAQGQYCHAEGVGTIANDWQLVAGSYNVSRTDGQLFIVGRGNQDNYRMNALTLGTNGNLWISGSLTQNSDRRLKTHCAYLGKEACTFMRKLRPALFTKDGKRHLGFYAQDVQAAEPANWDTVTVESEHNDESLDFDPLTLDYMALIAPLTAYAQELEKRVDYLESTVDSLIESNEELEEIVKSLVGERL